MKAPLAATSRGLGPLAAVLLLGTPCLSVPDAAPAASGGPAANTGSQPATDPEKAWEELRKVRMDFTPQPAEWQKTRPSPDELRAWKDGELERFGKAAAQAHDFVIRFPKHARAGAAQELELEFLNRAVQLGDKSSIGRRAALEAEQLRDPGLTPEARLKIRTRQVWQEIREAPRLGPAEARKAFEAGGRTLLTEFPDKPDAGYQVLLEAANRSEDENSRAIIAELLASRASDDLKSRAQGALRRLDAVGQPLDLQFTALDGSEVNLQTMKGKVVLIDFWATWCGPCVAEIPNIKTAYDKLHDQGFEVIGLSFDSDRAKLEKFVQDNQLPWPQFFDGKGWKNQYGQQFAINGIPVMWLIDKTGKLRDTRARGAVEAKVEKLLAE